MFYSFLSPVAVLLKDDYFVRGAGLPGRFKAEKMEFHWGQSNGSAGSEHSINGRRFPVEVKHSMAHFDECAVRVFKGCTECWSQASYCSVYIRGAPTFFLREPKLKLNGVPPSSTSSNHLIYLL